MDVLRRLSNAWAGLLAAPSVTNEYRGGSALIVPRVRNDASLSTMSGTTPFGTGNNGLQTNAAFSLASLHEAKPYERRQAMRNSRFLDNNLGIAGALNDGSLKYAVGEGIFAYASTGDPDYDSEADRLIDAIFESTDFDITGEQCMYELQPVVGRGMLVDGDLGAAKILPRDSRGALVGMPQVQLFKSDQIGTCGDILPGDNWLEGIQRNAVGRALKYRVMREPMKGEFLPRPWDYQARDFALTLDKKKVHLNRGMPWSHRAQRSGFSMMDLGALEEARAYVNAMFAAIITTPDGSTPEALEKYVVDQFMSTTSQKADGTTAQTQVAQKFVEMFGGGKIPVFPQGTELKAHMSTGPSVAHGGHMTYLAHQLAHSYGLTPTFFWSMVGLQGPETRMTLSQADWYFRHIMLILVRRFIKPMRDWLLMWGLLTGRLNNGKMPRNGADYRTARFRGPRKITIDERYFYRTWLDRIRAGLGTEEEFYAEQGKEWSEEQRQRVLEVLNLMRLCKEYGVPYEKVRESMPGSVPAGTPPATEPDDEADAKSEGVPSKVQE